MAAMPVQSDPPDTLARGGEVYPGAMGVRGVALSMDECSRRYQLTPAMIALLIRHGRITPAGDYLARAGRVAPLVWSGDIERYLQTQRPGTTRGKHARTWPDVVRREYAARGFGEPPAIATGEDRPAELPADRQSEPAPSSGASIEPAGEASAIQGEGVTTEYRVMYAGLAAAAHAAGYSPADVRALALSMLDGGDMGRMLAPLAPDMLARTVAELHAAGDADVLHVLVSAFRATLAALDTTLPALAGTLAPLLAALPALLGGEQGAPDILAPLAAALATLTPGAAGDPAAPSHTATP